MNHFQKPVPRSVSASSPRRRSELNSAPTDGAIGFDSQTSDGPYWCKSRRVLVFDETVVKQFTWPAENQELILTAFQELGWPERIDDPLPLREGICPKRRLHDTIKCLNRKREHFGIKFFGDGTGQGVCWKRSDS